MLIKTTGYIIVYTAQEEDIRKFHREEGMKVGDTFFRNRRSAYWDTNKLSDAQIWYDKKYAEQRLKDLIFVHNDARIVEVEITAEI